MKLKGLAILALAIAAIAAGGSTPARAQQAKASGTTPKQTAAQPKDPLDAKLNLDIKDAPLKAFFDVISEQTKIGFIMPDDDASVRVTMNLRHMKARDAINAILDSKRLTLEKIDERKYRIKPLREDIAITEVTGSGREVTKILKSTGKPSLRIGYRALSILLPNNKLRFVNHGDKVDVLVSFESIMADGRKEKVTSTVLQNVIVLDVERGEKPEDTGIALLELNPVEAEYAALSSYTGRVDLITRAPGDTEMHPMEIASFHRLFKPSKDKPEEKDDSKEEEADKK
ncbi:MAG: RcpC/CpaB family pilus assembly protein [Elusimicrobiales bacterium]|nr:RcpC/CpaB family pilus assembly protein [Elusimicrobiales bacterium]